MLALTPWLVTRAFGSGGEEGPALADFLPGVGDGPASPGAPAGAARRTAADLFDEAWAARAAAADSPD